MHTRARPVASRIEAAVATLGVVAALAACGSNGNGGDGDAGSRADSGGGGGTGGGGGGGTGGGGGGGGTGGNPESNPLLQGITAAHNAARAAVMPAPQTPMPPLQWSTTVAASAQAWAANCQFQHGGTGNYGQNIYADTGQGTAADVVASWVSEKANYDYASNACSSVCGHYTQVVWAASTSLGCGVQKCSTGSPFGGGTWNLWVCDYDPPGNFNGQKPY